MSKYKVVIGENSNYYDAIKYSFNDNICVVKDSYDIKKLESIAKGLSDNDSVLFFNLTNVNDLLLQMLPRNINKYLIFEYSVAEFSENLKLNEFLLIMKYLDMKLIKDVYCLNHTTYLLFKDKYKAKYLQLDTPNYSKKTGDSIGILTSLTRQCSSTMNMMSAITLTDFKKVRMYNVEKSVKSFAKKFNIKIYNEKSIDDAINNNDINIYINFSSTCYDIILKSMDRGIPCIVGNTDFFNSNEILKEYLVVTSDGDINEIRHKLLEVKKNKSLIMKEYKKFRKIYRKLSLDNLKQIKEKL